MMRKDRIDQVIEAIKSADGKISPHEIAEKVRPGKPWGWIYSDLAIAMDKDPLIMKGKNDKGSWYWYRREITCNGIYVSVEDLIAALKDTELSYIRLSYLIEFINESALAREFTLYGSDVPFQKGW